MVELRKQTDPKNKEPEDMVTNFFNNNGSLMCLCTHDHTISVNGMYIKQNIPHEVILDALSFMSYGEYHKLTMLIDNNCNNYRITDRDKYVLNLKIMILKFKEYKQKLADKSKLEEALEEIELLKEEIQRLKYEPPFGTEYLKAKDEFDSHK